jgi:hypothetical protein
MQILRPAALAVAGTATALTLGTLAGAPATAAPAEPVAPTERPAAPAQQRGASVTADIVTSTAGIAEQIIDIVTQQLELNANREGVVRSMLEGAWYKHDQGKNVLVMKADHPYTADLQGVTLDATYHPSGYPSFRVVAFDSGTVTNNGDGGYINWAFQGWFDRHDMTVDFRQP